MSRSRKKAIIKLGPKIDKDFAHKAVRCRVNAELKKDDPDINIICAGTKELNLEEWGTVFGMEYDPAWDSEDENAKARRK